jgi:hypothetical protein
LQLLGKWDGQLKIAHVLRKGGGMADYQKFILGSFVVAGSVFVGAFEARADAIDGSWCYKGRHLAIEGPQIRIPSGKQITGDYDRHGFMYKVPPGDKGAGTSIFMGILDDETMELRVGSEQARPEMWYRCATPIS